MACGLSSSPDEAIGLYGLMSSLEYLPSSPTLFNSGTAHQQMSSCYLLDSPRDELDSIYETYADIARLSKHAGGIGVAFHRVRSRGSLIRGTNGSVQRDRAVAQDPRLLGGRGEPGRAAQGRGLCLPGDLARRHRGIPRAAGQHWRRSSPGPAHQPRQLGPGLFMQRVEHDWMWSLFDPKVVPQLCDLHGEAFEQAYIEAEERGLFERQVPARQLYARMMRTLAETGNGWMTFKDAANRTCNQAASASWVVHLSNLCTEIIEVSSDGETAVCNLGSVNLGCLVSDGAFDFVRLGEIVRMAVPFLDRVVDRNYYPTARTAASNARWRPVGLGLMGLQDVFFQLRLAFDSEEATRLSGASAKRCTSTPCGRRASWPRPPDPTRPSPRRTPLRAGCSSTSGGSSLPTPPAGNLCESASLVSACATRYWWPSRRPPPLPSIAGCYECIEPQVSNLFKRETLSGEFLQVNTYLVRELQALGLWTDATRARIKQADGSVQGIEEIPADIRHIFRTAWEVPMRSLIDIAADRGPFIDQSQSLNLFVAAPTIGKLSSMYLHAWKRGLKTTYYLRSRPATRIAPATASVPDAPVVLLDDPSAVACSLEKPETCEACE